MDAGFLVAVAAYATLVVVLGVVANRRAGSSPEEYFLAGRRLGAVVLFMALFGTNITSFTMVGIPGLAYHQGIGVFGANVPFIAFGLPICFWAFGVPARKMSKRLAAVTPAELLARRFDSRAVGWVLFLASFLFTLPYMMLAVIGASATLSAVTDGAIGPWASSAAVVVLATSYILLGGTRATAWTNVVQGSLFFGFMLVLLLYLPHKLGGFVAATDAVRAAEPGLLRLNENPAFTPAQWISWGVTIVFAVIGFPHMIVRFMAARDDQALRTVCRFYSPAMALVWLPAILLGVWGVAEFPGLMDRESDRIFGLMVGRHLPAWLGAIGFLAVLAAVMSTLDAQILTLGSMIVRDVLPEGHGMDEVRFGRIFGVAVALLVWLLSNLWTDSIFAIAKLAFSGYTILAPTLLLGVRWRRFTARGAIASMAGGVLVLAAMESGLLSAGAFLPVFWALLTAFAAAVLVSLLDRAPDRRAVERAFGQ